MNRDSPAGNAAGIAPRLLAALLVLAGALAAPGARAQAIEELRTADLRLTHWVLRPAAGTARWIVSLHGSRGSARADLGVWQKSLGNRPIGVLAIQWWRGEGEDYLRPEEIYREIEQAVARAGIAPGGALLHGFSRGAANLYAVAALDAGRGRRLFTHYVASSGGVAPDYPPTRNIIQGAYGPRPLAGTRWVTACGGRDENPGRDGCPGMRRTAQWLKEQGASLSDVIEDPAAGHGALQLNPRNAERLFDLILH